MGINKARLCSRYTRADNPYELALKFVMERLVFFLEERGTSLLPIIAEARGKKEDNSLKSVFYDMVTNGTEYVSSERFMRCAFPLQFHNKRKNIAGVQLADLCAYPAARHILHPEKPNAAYEVVARHYCKVQGMLRGLKVFP